MPKNQISLNQDDGVKNTDEDVATYLGPKGYTIFKECIDQKELKKIKKELTVAPFKAQGSMGAQEVEPFPIFRETDEKIFVPRFYGIENFGVPDANYLSKGEDITVKFAGDLRPFQKPIVNKYISHAKKQGAGLLEIHCGAGKTVMGLWVITQLRKKTLIIVHKEFLLKQWEERIEQFIPDAKVGRIQGKVIDVEGKDIVIGMLQSLSMKDYPLSLFEQFGLTVVDEVHHIGAEVFGRSLFKIVTPYSLGLSATMNRKDRLTHVFKMFLGEIVYSKRREGDDQVEVRAIFYQNQDPEFAQTEYNYRHQVQYSKMIKKICEWNHRTEFILKVLQQLRAESKQQIMVLAHNKSVLKYIHDAVKDREIGTVGYYVGGMKEKALKETESKEIVIATYAMAEEALDIKSLATLIMATPKTSVEQSVGRILRQKHEKAIVVDIVDQHGLFLRQWAKRKAFFRKSKYRIISCNNKIFMKKYGRSLDCTSGEVLYTDNITLAKNNWLLLCDRKGKISKFYNEKKNPHCGDYAFGDQWKGTNSAKSFLASIDLTTEVRELEEYQNSLNEKKYNTNKTKKTKITIKD